MSNDRAGGEASGEPRGIDVAPVAVIMGSSSDFETMRPAIEVLAELGVEASAAVVSAHRSPLIMVEFARSARELGVEVIIAGAGGAAHLPGMVASLTTLPVIGVPVPLRQLDGMDSLLSIVQMPAGVPVATVGIGNARNAGLLAARILSIGDAGLAGRLADFAAGLESLARQQNEGLGSTARD